MQERPRFVWLIPGLGLLACLGPFSNDVFVPSMSLIEAGLQTSAAAVQLTVTALLIGFSLGALLYGPLSDRFGRKPMLCLGLVIYALGGALSAMSQSLAMLVAMRALQGFGGSAAMVLSRAIILDRWVGAQASSIMSSTAVFIFLAPVFAPLLGGLIAGLNIWQAVFWVQAGIGVLALVLTAILLPRAHAAHGGNVFEGIAAYATVLRNGSAIGYMMCTGFVFVGIIAFASMSSVVFVDHYGLSPLGQGVCFSIVMVGAAVGSFVNGRIVTRRGITAMIGFGVSCVSLGGTLTLIVCFLDLGVAAVVFGSMVYASGIGFVFANTAARTMSHFRENAGAVSAVYAVNQFLFGALITAFLSSLGGSALRPLGVSLAFGGIAAAALWWGWLRNTEFTRLASGNAA